MSRYIDADKLKKHIDYCGSVGGSIGEIINTIYDWAKGFIDAEPTADVVEVVRCKDCKKENTDSCPFYTCILSNVWSDEFCSRGDRKDD